MKATGKLLAALALLAGCGGGLSAPQNLGPGEKDTVDREPGRTTEQESSPGRLITPPPLYTSKIAYTHLPATGSRSIYFRNMLLNTPQQLNTGNVPLPYNPRWSPDGTKIAFVSGSGEGASWSIYVVSPAGGMPVRLTTGCQDMMPTWSPDGKQIAFVRGAGLQLWVMNADGTSPREIALPSSSYYISGLAWYKTTTGSQIAYSRWTTGIYRISPSGGTPVYVTAGHAPAFSRDGTKMAFMRNGSLYWCLVGGTPKLLKYGGPTMGSLSWSPNGDEIAFGVALDGSHYNVYRINLTGDLPKLVTDTGAAGDSNSSPDWSPSLRAY